MVKKLGLEVESLSNDQQARKKALQSYEVEVKLVRGTLKESNIYIETLERELERIHQTVTKLTPSVANIDMLLAMTPMAQIKKIRIQASVEIAKQSTQSFSSVLQDKMTTRFTSTDIFDLNTEVKQKISDKKKVKAPMLDAGIQATPSVKEGHTQKTEELKLSAELEIQTEMCSEDLTILYKISEAYEILKTRE